VSFGARLIQRIATDQVDAVQTMLAVAAGEVDEQGRSAWIQKNIVAR